MPTSYEIYQTYLRGHNPIIYPSRTVSWFASSSRCQESERMAVFWRGIINHV